MKNIKTYTASGSKHCDDLKQYLISKSVDFEEIDLGVDRDKATWLTKKTGYSVVPQIQIDDKFIVGFDRKKIDELLEES